MSGHSKWSKVKHQKAVTDRVKGALFTKAARAIELAVREAGGVTDPEANFKLRLAIEKARDVNMPKENIERAAARGKGKGESSLSQILYEGYGPGGAAILVETMTDNKQRTVALLKNLFDQFGGSIASPGAVSFLFTRNGLVLVEQSLYPYDTILEKALLLGASDVVETEEYYELYFSYETFAAAVKRLSEEGITPDRVETIMKPRSTITLAPQDQKALEALTQKLESLEDIARVFTNSAVENSASPSL